MTWEPWIGRWYHTLLIGHPLLASPYHRFVALLLPLKDFSAVVKVLAERGCDGAGSVSSAGRDKTTKPHHGSASGTLASHRANMKESVVGRT